ncbi:MAG: hypothetical protein ACJAQT_001073 [Akkermansiaceae bacterium]|jgi:hypothetical protein
MMSAIFGGDIDTTTATIGWACYLVAITQYLIIALITSADKAGDLRPRHRRTTRRPRRRIRGKRSRRAGRTQMISLIIISISPPRVPTTNKSEFQTYSKKVYRARYQGTKKPDSKRSPALLERK